MTIDDEIKTPLTQDRYFRIIMMVSVVVVALCLAFNMMNPPADGDSYEYAGVAANLAEDGVFRLDHIRVYHVPGQKIPQPAWNRATLWTAIIAPFHMIFGRSYLTFLVPYLLTLLLLAPSVYIFGREFFGGRVSFYAALATLLNPRVLHWSIGEDPGQPELMLIILTLFCLRFFIAGKPVRSGVAAAAALLTRLTGMLFLPFIIMWGLLYRRKGLLKQAALFVTAFCIVSSPLFIRNKIVFGDYFYSDQSASVLNGGDKFVEIVKNPSIFDIALTYRDAGELDTVKKGFTPRQFADFVLYNGRTYLFGHGNGVAWYPGVLAMLSPLMIPFVLYGAFLSIRDPGKSAEVLYPAVFLAAMIVLRPGYEDRYILPVVPFAMLLAFYAASKLAGRFRALAPASLIAVFVVLEVFPVAATATLSKVGDSQQSRYTELNALCRWVRENTPEDSVMMTIPFWSPQYLCDRPTVPPVKGGLGELKKVTDEFGVDYFMFMEYWGGDRFPRLSFLEPVVMGKYLELYKVDAENSDFRAAAEGRYYMGDFDFLTYFWEERFGSRFDVQPLDVFAKYAAGYPGGLVLYFLVCTVLLYVSLISKSFIRNGIYVVGAVAVFGIGIPMLAAAGETLNLDPPPVSVIQMERVLDQWGEGKKPGAMAIRKAANWENTAAAIEERMGLEVVPEEVRGDFIAKGIHVLFVPSPVDRDYMNTPDAIAENAGKTAAANARGITAVPGILPDMTEYVYGGVMLHYSIAAQRNETSE